MDDEDPETARPVILKHRFVGVGAEQMGGWLLGDREVKLGDGGRRLAAKLDRALGLCVWTAKKSSQKAGAKPGRAGGCHEWRRRRVAR